MEKDSCELNKIFIKLPNVVNILPYYGYLHEFVFLMRILCKRTSSYLNNNISILYGKKMESYKKP